MGARCWKDFLFEMFVCVKGDGGTYTGQLTGCATAQFGQINPHNTTQLLKIHTIPQNSENIQAPVAGDITKLWTSS